MLVCLGFFGTGFHLLVVCVREAAGGLDGSEDGGREDLEIAGGLDIAMEGSDDSSEDGGSEDLDIADSLAFWCNVEGSDGGRGVDDDDKGRDGLVDLLIGGGGPEEGLGCAVEEEGCFSARCRWNSWVR